MSEPANHGNFHSLYQTLRKRSSQRRVSATLKDSDGNLIADNDRKLKRWKEHFQQLLSSPTQQLSMLSLSVSDSY